MTKYFLFGFLLWLFGYILGILLFPFIPNSMIGWVIMPIGATVTIWVLIKKIKLTSMREYFLCGVIWMGIAILCDYLFLVQIFKPKDGYYKLDVYIYYFLTFALPLLVGLLKSRKKSQDIEI